MLQLSISLQHRRRGQLLEWPANNSYQTVSRSQVSKAHVAAETTVQLPISLLRTAYIATHLLVLAGCQSWLRGDAVANKHKHKHTVQSFAGQFCRHIACYP